MRLDKFLKVSRLIKRRTVANEACDAGRVSINGESFRKGESWGYYRNRVWAENSKSRSPFAFRIR